MLQILLIIYLHPKNNKQERVEWIIPVAANMTSQQWAIVTRSLQIRRDDLCSTILASMYALHLFAPTKLLWTADYVVVPM